MTKRDQNKVCKIIGVFNLSSSLVSLLVMIRPLFFVHGSVEGFVSLFGYSINVLGQKYISYSLDFISFSSFLLLLSNFLVVIFSVFLIYNDRFDGVFGAVLTNVVSLGILRGLLNGVVNELSNMNRIRDLSTTAGFIQFPQTVIEPTPTFYFLTNIYPIIIIIQVASTTSLYYVVFKDTND
ncbi:MAG: hypothetical protein ACP5IZ_09185 [Thermoprotei archaeon]